MMCLDISRMANPMKNGFTTFLTGVFNLIPMRFSEYMVVLTIISYPCFWMMALRSFHVVINFTFICFNSVYTNLPKLIQVLLHNGLGLCSFLTQHIHILEYEWSVFESNDVVNVSDTTSLLNVQLQERVMNKILSTRYKITYEFWHICLYHLVHNVVLFSIFLNFIWIHARFLYRKEWMEDHWICHGVVWVFRYHTRWSIRTCQMCWVIESIWSDLDWSFPSPILVVAHPPTRKASFDAWLHHTSCLHRDSRFLPCSQLLACSSLSMSTFACHFTI